MVIIYIKLTILWILWLCVCISLSRNDALSSWRGFLSLRMMYVKVVT